MTVPYLIENSLDGSYAVTSEFVQQFCERIRSITEKSVSLSVEYSSGHKEQYSDENSFLKSSWLHIHIVKSITIESGSYFDTSVQLRFSDFLFSKVAIRISGQRDRCISIEAEVLALIGSIKTYIAPLHSSRYNGYVSGAVLAVFGFFVYDYSKDALASVLLTLGFLFIAINLVAYIFPKYEVQIGKGKKTAARRRILTTFVFGFFILGGFASIYQDSVVRAFKGVISSGYWN